ncbi:hypothetical protein [Neoroseomonas oryzicola]|uniref:Uncharacterized protein n=1 Tax=Neoroseomonas oryzicola TaxID=535904 RepID=A0A9X9WEC2_9PROT|nr:hypothetical protein [Neoroseomonas oryzicola]MBR0658682.1 hypothetical protein [Neoroseomonas oryzicola]NKE17882.1 hypothetical protein [Neoroseomonas oryzicola]
MSADTPSVFARLRADASARWTRAKPLLLALGVGLVAGPIISGMIGFQVRTSTAQTLVHNGIVEQQAIHCASRARGDTPDTARLDWSARTALARRFSTDPAGGTAVDPDVARACADRLAR